MIVGSDQFFARRDQLRASTLIRRLPAKSALYQLFRTIDNIDRPYVAPSGSLPWVDRSTQGDRSESPGSWQRSKSMLACKEVNTNEFESTLEGNHSLKENGVLSNSGYNHDNRVESTLKNVQDEVNLGPTVSTSSSGPAVVAQGYSGYAAYPNADPHGYGSTAFAAYYNQYQQQQPNHYQQQSIQYQQLPNQSYPQSYRSVPKHRCSLSAFFLISKYKKLHEWRLWYPDQLWHGGQYATYSSHQYPNYNPDSNSAYSSNTAIAASQYQQHYKQWEDYYNQNQTEVSCAPGTKKISVFIASSVNSSVPTASASNNQMPTAYTPSWRPESSSSNLTSVQVWWSEFFNNQMPTAYTPSWRPESSSSNLTSVQSVTGDMVRRRHGSQERSRGITCKGLFVLSRWNGNRRSGAVPAVPAVPPIHQRSISGGAPEGYWKHRASAFQNDLPNSVQSHVQKPQEVNPVYESFQNQQNSTVSQGSNAPYPASYQVSQSLQSSFQTVSQLPETLDSRNAGKLQIHTNPRIASNLPLSLPPKTDKDMSVTSAAAKPAYIVVPMQRSNEKVMSHEESDFMLKRALARCKNDKQKITCQAILKELIIKATADGTLHTKNWDTEPLFPMPNTDVVDKEYVLCPLPRGFTEMRANNICLLMLFCSDTHSPALTSEVPKNKSPSRQVKKEKVVDKSTNISYGTAKYGGWNNKQRSFNKNVGRPAKRQRLGEDLNAADDVETSSDSDKEQSLTKYYFAAIAFADSPEEKKRLLSKTFEESGSRAVEDIDWDALTVKRICQEVEKRYLRLTSTPDPSTVRPEEVLEKALLMVQNSQKNYLYKCDQLKSIRQDLTVQHIRNEFTVKVNETYARLAIEVGDLPEYNQCQSQLKTLYAKEITGCHMEFAAYNLLCNILHTKNNRDLLSAMSRFAAISEFGFVCIGLFLQTCTFIT
ncbi:hypothetical protein CDL12_08096 [Handroanthus impetiginosus]|uniref:SAC3/GANP/THP3 conserved domain-containing protein n=1 Tax=Handroanthus impetiginosus TaxID=429701 RepID=A0A2G9HP58_9LAMI|nr:hypothetical protein CDL12_08096 [Handroanthus impetiginosus]